VTRAIRNRFRTKALLIVAAAAVLAGAVSVTVIHGGSAYAAARPLARFEPPNGRVYMGVSEPGGAAPLHAFDAAAGTVRPAIYNKYVAADGALGQSLTDGKAAPGSTMMLSWNVTFANHRVTDGADNTYLAAQVAAIRAYKLPVFLRLDWEMNAPWYKNYSLPAVDPAQYIASWRYVVHAFAGVTNAAFVWAPNVNEVSIGGAHYPTSSWYPGDNAVNWIGLDAYPQYAPGAQLLDGTDGMNAIATFAAAHGKPLMLSEWSPNLPHPDSVSPIDLILSWAAVWPNTVKALVYFDFNVSTGDHTLVDHPVGAAELRRLTVGNPRFLSSIFTGSTAPSTSVPSTTVPSTTG
jgi:hypothetical protein